MSENSADEVAKKTLSTTQDRLENRTHGSGLDAAEQRADQLTKVAEECRKQGMNMLIYDIPTTKNHECPNPSPILWHYGFRLNLSCWVLPDSSLQTTGVQSLLKLWQKHDLEVHIIPYAEKALVQIRQIALNKLQEEIVRQHTSFIDKLGNAADRLHAAKAVLEARRTSGEQVWDRDFVKLDATTDNQIRATINNAQEQLRAALDCARMFDEEESLRDLFTGLRAVVQSERLSFNAEMELKHSKPAKVDTSLSAPETHGLVHEDGRRYDFTAMLDNTVLVVICQHGKRPETQSLSTEAGRSLWKSLKEEGFRVSRLIK